MRSDLLVLCVIGLCCIFGFTQIQASNTTLLCRRCSRASTLSDCNTSIRCDKTLEFCYIDELITDRLTVVYNAGCRAKEVCSSGFGAIAIGRKRSDLVACSRCCNNESDCNRRLCGIKDGSTQIQASNDTLLCRRCSRASTLSDCNTSIRCDKTFESCYIDELITDRLTVVYNAGCRAKDVCSSGSGAIAIGRKRSDLVACSRCCNNESDCNRRLCGIKDGSTQIQASNTTLLCRRCSRASTLSDCNTSIRCDKTLESCYIDELITDRLTVVYNAGCRAKAVCSSGSGAIAIGRKRSDLVACSRCCYNESDCNSRLCGIKDDTVNSSQCYHCDHRSSKQAEVANPADCVTLTTCQTDEVCYATQQHIAGKDLFFYGCYSKTMCQIIMQRAFEDYKVCVANVTQPLTGTSWEQACSVIIRKRSANICHACCADSTCNWGSCHDINNRIFKLAMNGKFDMQTLKTTP